MSKVFSNEEIVASHKVAALVTQNLLEQEEYVKKWDFEKDEYEEDFVPDVVVIY